jgi:hypothetical protein
VRSRNRRRLTSQTNCLLPQVHHGPRAAQQARHSPFTFSGSLQVEQIRDGCCQYSIARLLAACRQDRNSSRNSPSTSASVSTVRRTSTRNGFAITRTQSSDVAAQVDSSVPSRLARFA